jgi:hypothetical protein
MYIIIIKWILKSVFVSFSNMTSLERIFFYSTKLPQEKDKLEITPDKTWPSKGAVTFENVTFRFFFFFLSFLSI